MKYSNYFNKKGGVFEAKYIEKNGTKYYVDGKNVVLDYTKSEVEMAKLLISTFGGIIYLLPRVNYPENIRTADYLWNNEFWDLKEVKGNSKRVLDNILKNTKFQCLNFILDINVENITLSEIIFQLKLIYNSNHRKWINKIIIIKNGKLLMVIKRG